MPRSMVIESRFAHKGSHSARKASTRTHEMTVVTAATLILTAIISTVDRGRTAMNPGIESSLDQKSGLENALPIAKARIKGISKLATRIRRESAPSFRKYHESGAITIASREPTKSANTNPDRRHSNQN